MQSLLGGDSLLDAFIRRGIHLKYYSHDDLTLAELVDKLYETLFTVVLHNDDHVLRYILPDRRPIDTVLGRSVTTSR